MYAFAALLTICVVVVEAAFARTDLSLQVVAEHSSTTTPGFYKLTAMWSSQEGSLLLWAWVLSLTSSAVLFATRRRYREIAPWATAVLMGLGAFFVGLMLFEANPFARLDPAPAEGVGLNPLLRHPAMAIHPPMLYSGYVFFSIPFAFAIGALMARRLDASWIRATRRFALIAWMLLGIGVLLGARWSYSELGWGGYWGWDPVENASLMPWLVGTAFLHSVMVQERRGMLRVWNVSLICGTFALALLGTFLVRSGILESIHAFGASTVGGPLLALIAIVIIGSAFLIVSRLDDLRSTKRIESLASREAVFLVNNLLLVGLAAVIFWGTFFPLISELFTGERASLAAPWFNRYTTPLAILLVLFTGIGPLLAWRRVSLGALKRLLGVPALVGLAAAVALFALTGARSAPLALVLFSLAAFSLTALAQEFGRGAAAYRGAGRRVLPAGAPGAFCAQPPPLRRLCRPRGARRAVDRGGGLLELSDQSRPAPAARRVGHRRRLSRHLRAGDGGRRAGRAAPHLRLGAGGPKGRQAIRHPPPFAELLRGGGEPERRGPDQGLLRGRGHQRGGTEDDRGRGLLDRHAARPGAARPDHQRGGPSPGPDRTPACLRTTPRRGVSSASFRVWRSARSGSAT